MIYACHVMQLMINELHPPLSDLFSGQFGRVIAAYDNYFKAVLSDVSLITTMQSFDLEVTRREKEALQEELNNR